MGANTLFDYLYYRHILTRSRCDDDTSGQILYSLQCWWRSESLWLHTSGAYSFLSGMRGEMEGSTASICWTWVTLGAIISEAVMEASSDRRIEDDVSVADVLHCYIVMYKLWIKCDYCCLRWCMCETGHEFAGMRGSANFALSILAYVWLNRCDKGMGLRSVAISHA